MTTDAGSGFDNQAAGRDADANLEEIEEESRHLAGEAEDAGEGAGDEVLEEEQERRRVHDEVNDAF